MTEPSVLCSQHAERYGEEDGRTERDPDQTQMLQRALAELAPKALTGERNLEPESFRQEASGNRLLGIALELHRPVHARHGGFVDRAFETAKGSDGGRRLLGQLRAIEQDCLVVLEIAQIVVEHSQPVARDLGIRGVDHRHVEMPGVDPAIDQVVIQTLHAGLGESVALA